MDTMHKIHFIKMESEQLFKPFISLHSFVLIIVSKLEIHKIDRKHYK